MPKPPLALERAFPALAGKLPRVALTSLPTRVHRLEGLQAELGASSLWVKRDDESCPFYGGNKPRKLEFLFGKAIAEGKRTVLTTGGIGTHHGLATAICARELGLKTILLLLRQPVTQGVRRSLLLNYAAGAEMHYASTVLRLVGRGLRVAAQEMLRNELPYIIPTGGTSAIGALGYVNAAFELREQVDARQLPEPRFIFVPVGSGGTAAGLVLGAKLAGLRSTIVGVLVTDIFPPGAMRLSRLAKRSLRLLRQLAPAVPRAEIRAGDFPIVHGYVGPAYGAPTDAGRAALERMQRLEQIHLEGTYTAKCLAAMIEALKAAPYRDANVLFWDTYNSVDEAKRLAPLPDYRDLPRPFHRFFSGPLEA